LRLEAAHTVPRNDDLDRADVSLHRLRADPVATVTAADRVVLLIAEMIGDLALQGGLQHALGQLPQQPALAGQLQVARAGTVDLLPDQLLVKQVRRQFDRPDLFNRLNRGNHIAHQVLLP